MGAEIELLFAAVTAAAPKVIDHLLPSLSADEVSRLSVDLITH